MFPSGSCIYPLQTLKRLASFSINVLMGRQGCGITASVLELRNALLLQKKVFASRLATYSVTGSSDYCFRNMEIALLLSSTSTF